MWVSPPATGGARILAPRMRIAQVGEARYLAASGRVPERTVWGDGTPSRGPERKGSPVVNASLILVTADKPPREVPLKKSTLIIGRQDTCHIRIPSDSVSRQHCELRVEDNGVTVRDLGSSNGTFVNKRRVNQAELAAGDVLSIGSFTFVVKIGDAPPSVDPASVLAASSPVSDATKSAPDHPVKPSSSTQPKPTPKPAAKPGTGGKGSVLDEIDTETLSKMADDSSFAEFDFSDDDEKNQPKL